MSGGGVDRWGHRDDRGSGSGLTLAVMALLALVATVVALVGAGAVQTSRVRSTADLAALAGARAFLEGGEACPAAERTARQNDAGLLSCEVTGDAFGFVVSVEVEQPLGLELPGLPEVLMGSAHAGSAELAAPAVGSR